MAHWPVGGPSGSLAFLRSCRGRKILIHVNNTNPILREDSLRAAAGDRRRRRGRGRRDGDRPGAAMTDVAPLWSADELGGAPARGGRASLPRSASFSRPHARGAADARAAPGLDPEPLLLPDADPHQRRGDRLQSEDPAFRRLWIRRIHDHDGERPSRGDWRSGCGWPRPSGSTARRWRAADACCPASDSPATPM